MKFMRNMPQEKEPSFKLPSEGEHKFQITDIYSEDESQITIKAEIISNTDIGMSIMHRVVNDENSDFFWVTKLFLKCIGEPHEGSVFIDTDNWIGRQFYGEIKHTKNKEGKVFANIKKLIPKDEPQPERKIAKEEDTVQW